MSSIQSSALFFPEELWIQILSCLSPRCLCDCMLVSSLFQRLSLTQSLWRVFCQEWGVNSLDACWEEKGYSLFFQIYKLLSRYGYLIGMWKAEVSPRGGLLVIKLVGSDFVGFTAVAKECTELVPVFKIQIPLVAKSDSDDTKESDTGQTSRHAKSTSIFVTPISPHPRYSSTQPLLNPLINMLYSMTHRRLENRDVWDYVEGSARPLLEDNDFDNSDDDDGNDNDYLFSTSRNNNNNNDTDNDNDNDNIIDNDNNNNHDSSNSDSNSKSHLVDSDMEEWKVGSITLLQSDKKEDFVISNAYFESDEEEESQLIIIYPWGIVYTKLNGINLDGKLVQNQQPQSPSSNDNDSDEVVLVHPICANFNLGGLWKSFYGGHGWEVVQVKLYTTENSEHIIAARKIIGDPNVPSGKFTWRTQPIRYGASIDSISSEGRLAELGFINSRWEQSALSIIDENHITLTFSSGGFQLIFVRLFDQVPLLDLA